MREFFSWRSYYIFAHKVHTKYRYIYDTETKDFLDTLLETSVSRTVNVKKGYKLWRTQLGSDFQEVYDDDGNIIAEEEVQFSKDRMKPLVNKATEGRANPKGIPYLYRLFRRICG